MKKPILKVLLVDVLEHHATEQIKPVLERAAAIARGRKQSRTPAANRMVAAGYPDYRHPHPETWRHSLARYLRRRLPAWTCVHVGGHHLAVHLRQRVGATRTGPISPECLARFIEEKPI